MPVREAAAELGVSRDALYRMIQRGQVEHIRLPNDRIVVEQAELDRIVEQGRVRRESAPEGLYEPSSGCQDGLMGEIEEMLRTA